MARCLNSAEGHLRFVMHGRPVDVAHPRLDLLRNPQAARQISGENRRRKSIFSIVGKLILGGLALEKLGSGRNSSETSLSAATLQRSATCKGCCYRKSRTCPPARRPSNTSQ
jgi:hypothetical protein